jgi:nucleoside-diphosphate-sugar epimerase
MHVTKSQYINANFYCVITIQNDMIKPAIKGVLNVLKASARAKEVKRVILTSSAAAVTINELKGTGHVMDETNWSDVEFLNTAKPPTWVKNRTLFTFLNHASQKIEVV